MRPAAYQFGALHPHPGVEVSPRPLTCADPEGSTMSEPGPSPVVHLIGGPYVETIDSVVKAFRPKSALRPKPAA